MANGLNKILGYAYLTGLVEDVKTGIPSVLPNAFWTTTSETTGDAGIYTRYAGTRQTLRRVEYGAPSVRRALEPIGEFPVKLANFFEHVQLKPLDYIAVRDYTSYTPMNRGKAEVDRQAELFVQKRENTKIAMVHSMLAKGAIYFDTDGNLLPTSSGAALTIDYGINANNQNQLNGVISASWATASTDIAANIIALQKRALQLTGYPIKYAFYGSAVPGYIAANTVAKEYLVRNPAANDKYLNTGVIPDGFLGLTWVPINTAFFVDANGATQDWFASDKITFAPEIDRSVYEYMRGSYYVPTTYQPTDSLQAAMASFKEVVGDYGYAVPVMNPLAAELHLGHIGLPIWKVPDALFIADVVP